MSDLTSKMVLALVLLLFLWSCHAQDLSPVMQPVQPVQPVQPDQPIQPVQPVQPVQPISEQPDQPDAPPTPPAFQRSGLPVVRIFSKANPALSLTGFWGGRVVMLHGNGSIPYQQWLVDLSWGVKFTDAVGSKTFALVNKGTGEVLRHSYVGNSPVSCSSIYKTDIPDALWTRGPISIFGFHTIRAWKRIELSLDMERSEKKRFISPWEGSKVILEKYDEEETQYWKMELI